VLACARAWARAPIVVAVSPIIGPVISNLPSTRHAVDYMIIYQVIEIQTMYDTFTRR
jgi:hypothetical protein